MLATQHTCKKINPTITCFAGQAVKMLLLQKHTFHKTSTTKWTKYASWTLLTGWMTELTPVAKKGRLSPSSFFPLQRERWFRVMYYSTGPPPAERERWFRVMYYSTGPPPAERERDDSELCIIIQGLPLQTERWFRVMYYHAGPHLLPGSICTKNKQPLWSCLSSKLWQLWNQHTRELISTRKT